MRDGYQLVVIGGGMAANRLMHQLQQLGFPGSTLVVSNEKSVGYNRILLPGLLAGTCREGDLQTGTNWHQNTNTTIAPAQSVVKICPRRQRVTLSNGCKIKYAKLVIATGSHVPQPDFDPAVQPYVFTLRNLRDAQRIKTHAATATHALVVGGGLLGLEAADALHELGLKVSVLHRGSHLMNRQLDRPAGDYLAQHLATQSINVVLNTAVNHVTLAAGQCRVHMTDGTTMTADLIVFATGAQPNIALAEQAGLACRGGICTNQFLQTSDPDIYAIGECARPPGGTYSLVDATHAQADALAHTLCGTPRAYVQKTLGTRLKVSGVLLFAAGDTQPTCAENLNDVVIQDRFNHIYRRLLFRGNRLIGAVLMGEISAAREIVNKMNQRVEPADIDGLAFGTG